MICEFSQHALEQMIRREIDSKFVQLIIDKPDSILDQDDTIKIYSKLVIENSKTYLYRVFINCLKNPILIVTVCKTSKTDKYVNKIRQRS